MPAAFWAVYWTARDAACGRACVEEALAAGAAEAPAPAAGCAAAAAAAEEEEEAAAGLLSAQRLPHIHAAVSESLRLCVASLTVRRARRGMELSLKGSGTTARLRAGDRVALAPALTHTDEAVYPRAAAFDHGRFLDGPHGGEARTKGGKRLGASVALQPFGGGSSMCPGRHLALAEVRGLLLLLLQRWEVELLEEAEAPPPPLDMTRAGLGVLPPSRGVPCRIRRRTAD